MMQSKIFSERIKKLQQSLPAEEVDLFLVENPVELFYLTGLSLSLGYLFVQEKKSILFVDGRYLEIARKKSPVPVEELSGEGQLSFLKGGKILGFNGDKISFSNFTALKKLCRKVKITIISKPHLLKKQRLIKDKTEVALMKKSALFAYQAYTYIKKKLKPGVTEIELARELQIYCLKNGAEKMSFEPIIAFGKNSSLPHHHPGQTRLKVNDIALFDLGVVVDNYCSDMTRVVFTGKEDPQLKQLFGVNRAAQLAALAQCRPGVALKELDIAARAVMKKAGLEEYFVHSLGHGIGLEVHEYPRIKKDNLDRNLLLEAGMAITIEPGLYLPGKGGVRYEDTIIITPNGYVNLYPEV